VGEKQEWRGALWVIRFLHFVRRLLLEEKKATLRKLDLFLSGEKEGRQLLG
jgi:hypothetical protein